MAGYMDDGMQGSTVLRKGLRFYEQQGELVMDAEQ
jgi:hypothetical protein